MTTNNCPKTADSKRKTMSAYYQTHKTHLGGEKRSRRAYSESLRQQKEDK